MANKKRRGEKSSKFVGKVNRIKHSTLRYIDNPFNVPGGWPTLLIARNF